MTGTKFLIADIDAGVRERLSSLLRREGFLPEGVEAYGQVLEKIESTLFDVVIIGIDGTDEGLKLLSQCHDKRPDLITFALTSNDKLDFILETIRFGAMDCILKPITRDNLITTVKKALARQDRSQLVPPPDSSKAGEFFNIISKS